MKYTLLQLVQAVLSSIDGDEVDSINDTVESQQVVKIIKTCYGDIVSRLNIPENFTLFQLTATDANSPTVMLLPTDAVQNLAWVKYDCQQSGETDTAFRHIPYVCLSDFLERMHGYAPSEDTSVTTFDYSVNGTSFQFIVGDTDAPSYYTTWDDSTLIFNSYDSDEESFLAASKTMCYGEKVPTWTESDSFEPPLDDHQLLLHESKALAWAEMKQAVNARAEKSARNFWIQQGRQKTAIPRGADYYLTLPNYGRK